MKNKETKARFEKAYRAMKALGIEEYKVKPVLKKLLKLADNKWALIEAARYRALVDAIFDRELEAAEHLKKHVNNEPEEEETQATKEPERPLKKLRRRHQNGQTSSLNTSNSSMPKAPLVSSNEEPDELSEPHLKKLTGLEGVVVSPQHNARKTMTKSPGSSKGKRPISSMPLVPNGHEQGGPSLSSINRSQKTAQLKNESRSHSHPMKLRERGKEAASLQNPSKEKRPVPESSSHAVPLLKEPEVKSDILLSPKKNKATNRSLITPKDEPIIEELPCPEMPDVIINTVQANEGDSSARNGLLNTREPSALQSETQEETGDVTATLRESRNGCALDITSGVCSSSNLEIASSASGEVKISLSYNVGPERPYFSTPSLEAVLKSVEDKYQKSTKISEPKVSTMKLIEEICEHFLVLGTDSSSQSLIMELTPTIKSMSKSYVADDKDAKCLCSGAKVPWSTFTVLSPPCKGINGGPPQMDKSAITRSLRDVVDIAKGHENVVITLVNEVNDESPPSFCYIPKNAVFQNAYMNSSLARIGDDNCCATCSGDCLSSSIPCPCSYETGGEYAYTADGLVKEEFLKEHISMNRNPKKHCQFFCKECPLERSKCEGIIEPCKGHLVRKFIKECWRKCGCRKQCGNRVVQRGITRKLQVFMTQGKGWGLRTLEDLPKGAFVCEYVGEVLTNAELFERVLRKSEGEKHSYPVLLDADWCAEGVLKDEEALCLDATYYGNVARFINHKCYDSNLVEIPVEIETPDHHYYHLAFFTARKVKAMEELTWDYGIDFDDHEHPIKAFRCQCGSKFCRNIKRSRSRARR